MQILRHATKVKGHQPPPSNTFEVAIGEAWVHDVVAVYQALDAWLTNEGRDDLKMEAWNVMTRARRGNMSPFDACDKIRELLEQPKKH